MEIKPQSDTLVPVVDPLKRTQPPLEAEAPASTASPLDPLFGQLSETLQQAVEGPGPYDQILALINRRIDHRAFFESNNLDPVLNAANSVQVSGGDLNLFLDTLSAVQSRGYNVQEFCHIAKLVAQKGDYDDTRRFLNVTRTVMARDPQALPAYYDLCAKALAKFPEDFEGIVFQLHTALRHGASVSDFAKLWQNLPLHGFDGDNNAVDLNRVMIDIRNRGGDVAAFVRMMGQSGDGRRLLDEYMAKYGLASTCPDRSQFVQIQRMDQKEPMVIEEGEKSALFCQAISDMDGLLPESCVFWSSPELGAVDRGWTLELDKLPPGTYHFYAKIGNYPGTDTAIRTVIVKPKGDHDRGHGNDLGQYDADNPGQGRRVLPHASEVATDFSGLFKTHSGPGRPTFTPNTPQTSFLQQREAEAQRLLALLDQPETPLEAVLAHMSKSEDEFVVDVVKILEPFRRQYGDEAVKRQLQKELEAYLQLLASLR